MQCYFDHNSTSPLSSSVLAEMPTLMGTQFANPSSEHKLGLALSEKIDQVRVYLQETLHLPKRTVWFTGGATESINTVLHPDNVRFLGVKKVVSSDLEHHATLECLTRIEKAGIPTQFVKNKNGVIDLDNLKALVDHQTLVSLLWVNNETGIVQDLKSIAKICKEKGAILHVDAVQAPGKVAIDFADVDLDFASFSGHKFGAFKGVGFLVAKRDFSPLLVGGGHEKGKRAGTYNFPGIFSLELALKEYSMEKTKKVSEVRHYFEDEIKKISDQIIVNGAHLERCSNTSNIYIPNIPNQAMLMALSEKQIYVSTGSACSSGVPEPSHVLQAMGYSKEYSASCLRFSFGPQNTMEQVDYAIENIAKILRK